MPVPVKGIHLRQHIMHAGYRNYTQIVLDMLIAAPYSSVMRALPKRVERRLIEELLSKSFQGVTR
ncbi:hypothetical protein HG66A1_18040 [Gimesia chilikensis]|uniref:Uncharacterized protein n=1 Tax=Gimesia chilikensis TaxID=2605989 RepID=A0A517PKW9_9PLAN|nr:hypothetical protein HG66A1_18040 [Gimesia chilikensis]